MHIVSLIPAYNSVSSIELAIRSEILAGSVLDDRFTHEVCVFDDGSTDGTRELLENLKQRFENLNVEHGSVNKGRPHARNRLLEMARGDAVCWLDADDVRPKEGLRVLSEAIQLHGDRASRDAVGGDVAWVVLGSFERVWKGNENGRVITPSISDRPVKDLARGRVEAYLWSTMFSKKALEVIGLFDDKLQRLQDLDFLLTAAERSVPLVIAPSAEPVATYFKNDRGANARIYFRSWKRVRRKHKVFLRSYGHRAYRSFHKHHIMVATRISIASGNRWFTMNLVIRRGLFFVFGRLRRVFLPA